MEWAHLLSCKYIQIRWRLDNAFNICHTHHAYFHAHPSVFKQWAIQKIGEERYWELKRLIDKKVYIDYQKVLANLKRFRDGAPGYDPY